MVTASGVTATTDVSATTEIVVSGVVVTGVVVSGVATVVVTVGLAAVLPELGSISGPVALARHVPGAGNASA